MTKNEVEFNYRGVQVEIRKNFGYQYYFISFNQIYSRHYDILENAKIAAKQEIDRLTLGKIDQSELEV
jgi:hypothetical protein